MKKTTSAGGAMAELLSKHNEHEIKEQPVQAEAPVSSSKVRAQMAQNLQNRNETNNVVSTPAASGTSAVPPSTNSVASAAPRAAKRPVESQRTNAAPNIIQPQLKREVNTRPAPKAPATPKPQMQKPVHHPPQMNAQRPPVRQHVQSMSGADPVRPAAEHANNVLPKASKVKKQGAGKKIVKTVLLCSSFVAAIALIVGAVVILLANREEKTAVDAYLGCVPAAYKSTKLASVELDSAAESVALNNVSFAAYEGETISCLTADATVDELMEDMNITLAEDQIIQSDTSVAVTDGMVVNIDKLTYGTATSVEYTDYETKIIDVRTIPKGTTSTYKKGSQGEITSTYNITYINGVEVSRELVSEVVTKQPVTAVVYHGVGGTFTVGGVTYNYSYYIDCKTTVYCLEGTTATGLPTSNDVIAVDPKVIPLGSKVYVEDYYADVGFRIAADTGGAIKGNFIDIWFSRTDPRLYGYGVRSARVYILE